MIELDSQKQELNCKIIAGKVSIPNVEDFLSSLYIKYNSLLFKTQINTDLRGFI